MKGCSKSIQVTLTTDFVNKEQFIKSNHTEEIQHFFVYRQGGGCTFHLYEQK